MAESETSEVSWKHDEGAVLIGESAAADLHSSIAADRERGCQNLGLLGAGGIAHVDVLLSLASLDVDGRVQLAAATAILSICEDSETTAPWSRVAQLLQHETDEICELAAQVLSRFYLEDGFRKHEYVLVKKHGGKFDVAIIESIRSPSRYFVRFHADGTTEEVFVNRLRHDDKQASEAVLDDLCARDLHRRCLACDAAEHPLLAAAASPDHVKALFDCLQSGARDLRQAASQTLASFRRRREPLPELELIDALRCECSHVRLEACLQLALLCELKPLRLASVVGLFTCKHDMDEQISKVARAGIATQEKMLERKNTSILSIAVDYLRSYQEQDRLLACQVIEEYESAASQYGVDMLRLVSKGDRGLREAAAKTFLKIWKSAGDSSAGTQETNRQRAEEAVASVVDQLHADFISVRRKACQVLGCLGKFAAPHFPALVAAMLREKEMDSEEAEAVVDAVAQLLDEGFAAEERDSAFALVVKGFESTEENVKMRACRVIDRISQVAPIHTVALANLLTNDATDESLAQHAAKTLLRLYSKGVGLHPEVSKAVQSIAQGLTADDAERRLWACRRLHLLAHLAGPHVEELAYCMQNDVLDQVREASRSTLFRLLEHGVVPAFISLFTEDRQVSERAVVAFIKLLEDDLVQGSDLSIAVNAISKDIGVEHGGRRIRAYRILSSLNLVMSSRGGNKIAYPMPIMKNSDTLSADLTPASELRSAEPADIGPSRPHGDVRTAIAPDPPKRQDTQKANRKWQDVETKFNSVQVPLAASTVEGTNAGTLASSVYVPLASHEWREGENWIPSYNYDAKGYIMELRSKADTRNNVSMASAALKAKDLRERAELRPPGVIERARTRSEKQDHILSSKLAASKYAAEHKLAFPDARTVAVQKRLEASRLKSVELLASSKAFNASVQTKVDESLSRAHEMWASMSGNSNSGARATKMEAASANPSARNSPFLL